MKNDQSTYTPINIYNSGAAKIKQGFFQDYKWLTRSLVSLAKHVSSQTTKRMALEKRIEILEKANADKNNHSTN